MEEITNLMEAANSAINNLENFIFENKKAKYINLKTVTDYMNSQIASAEMTLDLHVEEGYESAKANLNEVVTKCNELIELFQTKDNFLVIVNENGEIVTQDVTYENTQAPLEVSIMDYSENQNTNASLNETEATPEIETLPEEIAVNTPAPNDTVNDYQAFAPEILEAPELDMFTPSENQPEVTILDDTTLGSVPNDYSQDLDVAAVDAFLGGSEQENVLKL